MKKTKLSILFGICLTCLFLMAMTPISPQMSDMATQLKEKTMEILQLRQTVSELRLQNADYRTQLKNDRIALEPARFASEKGNNTSLWLRNPDHLKNVWKWTQQYKCLLTPESLATAKTFNMEYFVFAWCFKESHFNPYATNKNKNGSTDWGMAQINDCVWDGTYARLPEELKKRKNPKQDPEIAVAMLYIWINGRVEAKWSYCYLSPEAWELMWRLNQING